MWREKPADTAVLAFGPHSDSRLLKVLGDDTDNVVVVCRRPATEGVWSGEKIVAVSINDRILPAACLDAHTYEPRKGPDG